MDGFQPRPQAVPALPPIRHVVLIVKESLSYDEVLGDITNARNGPVMGDVAPGAFGLPRFRRRPAAAAEHQGRGHHAQPPRPGEPLGFQRQLLCRWRSQRGRAPLADRRLSEPVGGELGGRGLRRAQELPPGHCSGAAQLRGHGGFGRAGRHRGSRHAVGSPGGARRFVPELRRRIRAGRSAAKAPAWGRPASAC